MLIIQEEQLLWLMIFVELLKELDKQLLDLLNDTDVYIFEFSLISLINEFYKINFRKIVISITTIKIAE